MTYYRPQREHFPNITLRESLPSIERCTIDLFIVPSSRLIFHFTTAAYTGHKLSSYVDGSETPVNPAMLESHPSGSLWSRRLVLLLNLSMPNATEWIDIQIPFSRLIRRRGSLHLSQRVTQRPLGVLR